MRDYFLDNDDPRAKLADMQRRDICGDRCGDDGACMLALDGKCYSKYGQRVHEHRELEARVAKEHAEMEKHAAEKLSAYEELAASAREKEKGDA